MTIDLIHMIYDEWYTMDDGWWMMCMIYNECNIMNYVLCMVRDEWWLIFDEWAIGNVIWWRMNGECIIIEYIYIYVIMNDVWWIGYDWCNMIDD